MTAKGKIVDAAYRAISLNSDIVFASDRRDLAEAVVEAVLIAQSPPAAQAREGWRAGYDAAVEEMRGVVGRTGSPAARWAADYLAAQRKYVELRVLGSTDCSRCGQGVTSAVHLLDCPPASTDPVEAAPRKRMCPDAHREPGGCPTEWRYTEGGAWHQCEDIRSGPHPGHVCGCGTTIASPLFDAPDAQLPEEPSDGCPACGKLHFPWCPPHGGPGYAPEPSGEGPKYLGRLLGYAGHNRIPAGTQPDALSPERCCCGTPGTGDFDGPHCDCPVHGEPDAPALGRSGEPATDTGTGNPCTIYVPPEWCSDPTNCRVHRRSDTGLPVDGEDRK